MNYIIVISVAFIAVIVLVLIAFLCKRIIYYENIHEKIAYANITEKMFEIMAANISTQEKFEKLNESILKEYNSKYSSIMIYDGYKIKAKATNVEEEYIETIEKVSKQREFATKKETSKYITSSDDKTLVYTSAPERKIKSALYSPIYHNNNYLGFWLLEDINSNSFEKISKEELLKLKKNIGVFIENVSFHNILETAENTDHYTGYYNNMYMYSNSRQISSDFNNSSVTLVFFKNMLEINEKYGVNIGNELLIKIANIIKEMLPNESLYIRYSERRLVIITPNKTSETIHPLVEQMLARLKKELEIVGNEKTQVELQVLLHTLKNQSNIEKEVQKMISYINYMKDVNTIKII